MAAKKKKKYGKKNNRTVLIAALAAVLVAAGIIGLLIYGASTGLIGTQTEAEAATVVSESITEAERLAQEQAAAEEAARLAAEEEARKKAEEEEAARKKAEEEAAAAKAAEEALIAAHPELTSSITYQLPTGDVVLDKETLLTWLTDNGDGTYTKDEDAWNTHIAEYVADMADSVDTVNKDRTFQATGIGEVTLNTGSYYGWEVDQETEIAQLTEELNSGTVTEREPNYLSTEVAKMDDNDGIGSSYCEVDASRQHLWIYKDGELVFETDVVTGLMDESHYTPEGVYLLLSKEQNATLKGTQLPDGSYTYETPVSYWMPFTYQGHGLHDAYWKSVFGYGENVWNGSHGCVNLPAEVAETVYNLMTYDMPIVIYYSEGCELRAAPASELDQYIAAQEAAAAQKAAEEAAAQQAAEEAAAQQAAEEEAARQAEEAAAAQKAAEEEAARQAAEEAAAQQAAEEAAAAQAAAEAEASASSSAEG